MAASGEVLQAVDFYHLELNWSLKGEYSQFDFELVADVQSPDRMKGEVFFLVAPGYEVNIHIVNIGDSVYSAGTDTGEWEEASYPRVLTSALRLLEEGFLANLTGLTVEEAENAGGNDYYRVTGGLPIEMMAPIIGHMDDDYSLTEYLDGELKVDYWIGPDDALLRRFSAEGELKSLSGEETEFSLVAEISGFDEEVVILVPEVMPTPVQPSPTPQTVLSADDVIWYFDRVANRNSSSGAGYARSSPVMDDGVLYARMRDSALLFALDASTGTELWDYKVGRWEGSSPKIEDGLLYIGFDDPDEYERLKVIARDLATGEDLWTFSESGTGVTSLEISEGAVYVGINDRQLSEGRLYSLDARTGERLWNYPAANSILSSPSVVDGIVYFGSRDSGVYAVDSMTGELVWRQIEIGPVTSAPTTANSVTYAGTLDGDIYALDAASGDLLWRQEARGEIEAPPTVSEGMVYVGSEDRRVYAMDALTGELIWRIETGGEVRSSPVVSDGILYFGSEDGHIHALDATNGERLWSRDTGAAIYSSPLVSDDIVYVKNIDDVVLALDISESVTPATLAAEIERKAGTADVPDGLIWKRYVGHPSGWSSAKPVAEDGVIFVPTQDERLHALDMTNGENLWTAMNGRIVGWQYAWVVAHDGAVYMPSSDNWMSARDALTGELLWTFDAEAPVAASPVVAHGSVYFGSWDSYLYAIDALTGKLKWRTKTRDGDQVWPNVSEGVVYYGSDNGTLYALDEDTGEPVWQYFAGNRLQSYPKVVEGVVYFTSWNNHVYAVDGSTGELLWKFRVEKSPSWASVANGVVYVADWSRKAYAIDAETGELVWSAQAIESISSGPGVKTEQEVVFAGASHGGISALDAATGERLWEYHNEAPYPYDPLMWPITIGQTAYIGYGDGLYVRDIKTGELLRRYEVEGAVWRGVVVEDGVAYFSSSDGFFYALDVSEP